MTNDFFLLRTAFARATSFLTLSLELFAPFRECILIKRDLPQITFCFLKHFQCDSCVIKVSIEDVSLSNSLSAE